MITFFVTAKSFTGLAGIIQTNGITSWTKLKPKCEIIIFGREEGVDRISKELGIIHVPDINYGKHGKPLVNELFKRAEEISSHKFLCYINADMILTDDFMKAFDCLAPLKKKWLMVSRRHNLVLKREIDYRGPFAVENIKAAAVQENRIGGPNWIDYFLHTKGLFNDIPPFALGAWRWDNWLLNKALSTGAMVIDATQVVTAIHQDHDPPEYEKTKYALPSTEEIFVINSELFAKYTLYDSLHDVGGSIDYATHVLDKDGLKREKIFLRERIIKFLICEPYRRLYMKAICRLCHKLIVQEGNRSTPVLTKLWYYIFLPIARFPRNCFRKFYRGGFKSEVQLL